MATSSKAPAFLFDLDGTLVDSVYQHVLAWREALERCGIELAVWRIGMSGGLLVNALLRETGHPVTPGQTEQLPQFHSEAYACYAAQLRPLRGAIELLAVLVITRDQVERAKPDPDLFLAGADRLGVDIRSSVVVGDSISDLLAARRANALGVGLLSGGYGQDELERAGAYRVYQDPFDLLQHLHEVGVRVAA